MSMYPCVCMLEERVLDQMVSNPVSQMLPKCEPQIHLQILILQGWGSLRVCISHGLSSSAQVAGPRATREVVRLQTVSLTLCDLMMTSIIAIVLHSDDP